jgi:DNA-binding Lrp family transcriptional regulator
MPLDHLSRALLKELVRDGRSSHVKLAETIGLSATAVARRQRTLEDEGVIVGYHARLSQKALGLGVTVIVRLALDSQSEEALAAFEKAVARCPSVLRCFLMSGADDYLLTVVASDVEDFENVHKSQLSRLPHVARIQSSFALRQIIDRPVLP